MILPRHITALVHGMGSLGSRVMACIEGYEALVLYFGVFEMQKNGLLHGKRDSIVDDGIRK